MSRSRHLVDPQLGPLLDAWPTTLLTPENLAEVRSRELPILPTEAEGADWEERRVPGPAGAADVLVRIYRPRGQIAQRGCIFHIHGGGYVLGSVKEMEPFHRPLAAALDCIIVTAEYRLAPETPFPGAIDDCYAALAWTFANAAELGIDKARIGVMGESAGGGLAAALALMARDRCMYRLAFQHLIYPMIDDRTCAAEPHPIAGEFIWPPENNTFGWTALLGHEPGRDGVSAYAAAARAKCVGKLPPTFIATGALDLFVDEDIAYAQRLIRAGVPTELHVWPGAFHGFDLVPGAAVSAAAQAASLAALRRFLAPK